MSADAEALGVPTDCPSRVAFVILTVHLALPFLLSFAERSGRMPHFTTPVRFVKDEFLTVGDPIRRVR